MIASFTVGEAYGAIPQFEYPAILVEGPRGTSKSRSILSIFLGRLLRYPGSRLLLCRRFRTDLSKTILVTLEKEVFPAFGMDVPGGAHRGNRSEYELPNGSTIFLAGIDDGMGILSMGLTFCYAAEVIEMGEETITDIFGAMRWMRSPENPNLPGFTQIIMDTNPGPPGHWANQRAEPINEALRMVKTKDDYFRLQQHNYSGAPDPIHQWKRIVTKHQDNPGYWDHDAWEYTELGRKYVAETLEGLTGYKRERWLNGLWEAAEGAVYREFRVSQHVLPVPFPIPEHWPVYVGYDPGYDHPAAVLWFAIGENGCTYIFDEIYSGGLSVSQLAEAIHKRNEGRTVRAYYGDPQHINNKTAQSPKSIAQQFRELPNPIRFGIWPRTGQNEDQMVQAVREKLINRQLKLFPNCQNTIREFQSWKFKRAPGGDLPPGEDKYEDKENHALDVVKGLIALNLKHERSGIVVVG